MRRSLLALAFAGSLFATTDSLAAGPPSAGVLVQTSGEGIAISSAAIEERLREAGYEAAGAVRGYIAFEKPETLDDAWGAKAREHLSLDALFLVDARPLSGATGELAIRLRTFGKGGRKETDFFSAPAAGAQSAIVERIRAAARLLGVDPDSGRPATTFATTPSDGNSGVPDVQTLGITPIAIFQPAPAYPVAARAVGASGRVIVHIVVGTDGTVSRAKVLFGDEPFQEAALEAVSRWRYQPVVVNGEPIVWASKVNLRFAIDDGRSMRRTTAVPRHFRDSGTREKGIFAGFGAGSSETSLADDADSSASQSELQLAFLGAAFARTALEIQGRLEVVSSISDDRRLEIALGPGAGWFFEPRDGWLVGPQVTALIALRSGGETRPNGRRASYDGKGLAASAGVAVRIPIGQRLLSVEAAGYERLFDVAYTGASSANGRSRETGVRFLVGVSSPTPKRLVSPR